MKLTFYGHSCFAVEAGGKNILFDPFISANPLAAHIDIEKIEADYLLLSHGHQDHVLDAEAIAKRTGAKVVSNYEIVMWLAAKGISNYHPMNIGGMVKQDFGQIHYVNAVHSSGLPDGSYGGNPGGFVIRAEQKFYFAGDTALTLDMQLVAERHQLDFAVLPIGDNFTMGVDEAIRCCDLIKCNRVVGVHYNTFPYIAIDVEEAKNKFRDAGKELILPAIGETIEL